VSILVRAYMRRAIEPYVAVRYCGEARELAVVGKDAEDIGNPFPRRAASDAWPGERVDEEERLPEWEIKGLGEASEVAGPEDFTELMLAAMGAMSEEALAALRDLAEAVCARLRWMEEEAAREAEQLERLLGSEASAADSAVPVGTPALRAEAAGTVPVGTPGPSLRRFEDALVILEPQIGGDKTSPAFGVCLAMGIEDVLVQGDSRLAVWERRLEEAVLDFADRWLAAAFGGEWVLKRLREMARGGPQWI
jgi:hypothetical protein